MNDDWRVKIDLGEEGGLSFLESVRELALEHDVRRRLGDRVMVSADGPTVFLYTDAPERAREAAEAVGPLLAQHRLTGDIEIARWHPEEALWVDPSVPLPRTEQEREAEHELLIEREARQSRRAGHAEWEVRVELPDHGATVKFADRLEEEGLPVVRRWRYVVVGAASEDEARTLAQRLEAEAPDGSRVQAEGSGALVWKVTDQNAFTIFGGMAH